MINIVIADDHELIREGVKKIVRSHPDMRIVGEAADLAGTLGLVRLHGPDVVVLDINLPDYDGLEGLSELHRHFPDQRVVLLSMYGEEKYAISALRAGAMGYVTKSMAADELVRAIRQIVNGETYIGPRLAELMARQMLEVGEARQQRRLTKRETEIVSLIGAGLQVKQVAAELAISVSSVNTYRNRIFRKLGVQTNAALIRYALKSGYVS
ncbi:response regulator [Massilia sp. 2TAF26]|uniref:response regulator n=1 Tax=Massilia sp. 2TAF26 TaxID=3233012 RepID=UPI003F964B90